MFRSQFSIWLIAGGTCKLLCVMSLLCMLASCQWRDARAVIATADSLDVTEHVIYSDTAVLGGVIRDLDNPVGRLFHRNTLGKAYYYMGRNLEDYYQQVAEAAECYIEANRLQIDDPIYRGRVNSCMGSICAQNNNDSLALIFYERASEDFAESGDEWRYIQVLLDRSEFNINLHNYITADSLLQIAQSYLLDSSYQARYYETRGLYFYEQQQYDSALVYFNQGLSYWQNEEDKCFSYLKLVQIYLWTNSLELAIPYAQNIVKYSNNPNFLINAYYSLLLDATNNNNLSSLSQYSHAREDANRLLESLNESYSLANKIIQNYNQNPHPWRWVWITIIFFIVLCSSLIICIIVYRKYAAIHLNDATTRVQDVTNLLHNANEKIVELEEYENKQRSEYNFDKCLTTLRTYYPQPCRRWVDYYQLKKDVEQYLHDWILKLEKLNLSEREKVFCILTLLYPHASTAEMATYVCYAPDGVRVLKYRLAKKIGIKTSKLFDFLYKLAF